MPNYLIAPSILSANLADLGNEVNHVLEAGADLIHFDVMDNHYVPNLTFGPAICHALRQHGITAPIDVHLMVKPVDTLITMFAEAGANMISIHPETTQHLDRSLQLIKDHGCQAGLALNPATPLQVLDYCQDKLDFILMMTVNPGFGGQKFIQPMLKKIQATEAWRREHCPHVRLAVDGGVTVDNIASIANAGADIFVAGSAIFGQNDYAQTITRMRKQLASNPQGK